MTQGYKWSMAMETPMGSIGHEGRADIAVNDTITILPRAARLALIAEEVYCSEVILVIYKFLKDSIEPWLDGTFGSNGFLYDKKWGGIVSKQGAVDSGADFGFGVYNDHHYHLGYFLYAISMLIKIDPTWGKKYKPQAYSFMADFMNLGRGGKSVYPRLSGYYQKEFDNTMVSSFLFDVTGKFGKHELIL
ncbi:hypothetical protein RJ640_013033 [Escallonia rubra]|uniref:glucan endo-1,3-beta-D-glucosidase n=1 Tax=Escallonia rubra TaxID=112253 RepID=A0AA88R3Z3_9ASTE|nr:hypothetical protein RJ640_013033 [Escallonia rubra]